VLFSPEINIPFLAGSPHFPTPHYLRTIQMSPSFLPTLIKNAITNPTAERITIRDNAANGRPNVLSAQPFTFNSGCIAIIIRTRIINCPTVSIAFPPSFRTVFRPYSDYFGVVWFCHPSWMQEDATCYDAACKSSDLSKSIGLEGDAIPENSTLRVYTNP
jgi:hypothetical protein